MNICTSIGEGLEGADPFVCGGVDLGRQLDRFGPDAFVPPGERRVDRGYEFRVIDLFLATGCTYDEPG